MLESTIAAIRVATIMWITLNETDLQGKLAGPELTAIQTVALSDGQTNPVQEVLNDTAEFVRGFVANQPRNIPLGNGVTVPSKLKSAALAIAVHEACSRLPTRVLLTPDRIRQYDNAIHLLERVADGRFAVDRPAPDQIDTVEAINAVYPAWKRNMPPRRFADERGV